MRMHRSRRLAALLVGAVLLVAGCGEDQPAPASAQASPSPPPVSPLPVVDDTASEVPPVVAPGGTVDFLTPTGNIRCGLTSQSAVCEVKERTYEPPPKPADCELDHGSMIAVGRQGPADFVCHGDTGFGYPTPTLAYGRSTTNGLFVCSTSKTGVACRTSDGRHGFEIARASYRVF